MDDTKVQRIARRLLEARASGQPIDTTELDFQPDDPDEAYAVQSRVTQALGPVSAWKVGASSADGPSHYAPLASAGVYESPARLSATFRLRGIEVEIGYRLATDLPARDAPYGPEEIAKTIDAVLPVIEVVESRLVDRERAGPLWALADHQSHGALVIGPRCERWHSFDALAPQVHLEIAGKLLIDGPRRNAAGDPFGQVVQLANLARHHGGGLRAGQVITTGSLTGIELAPAGASVRADIASLGAVELTFE